MLSLRNILIVLVLGYSIQAGASSGSSLLLFETVTANEVNLNARIFTLLKDTRGFLWLGTDAGLSRYDGYSNIRIQLPNPDHSSILATSSIEALANGKDSTLWIGSSQGLFHLNLNTWQSQRPGMFQDKFIRVLLYQNDTCLWVGTNDGLYRYNPRSGRSQYYSRLNSGLSQNVIRALYMDKRGSIWVGTADKLNVLHRGESRFISFDLKGGYKPNINHNLILDIQALSEKNDSVLVVGTGTGLCLFNTYTSEVRTYNSTNSALSNEVVKTIYINDSGDIYFGTDLGFNKLNLKDDHIDTYYHNPFNQYSIVNNEVWKILPDKQGTLWLATSNGLSRLKTSLDFFKYHPVYFSEAGELSGTRVADVLYDPSGTCWVGTSYGLVAMSDPSGKHDQHILSGGEGGLSTNYINSIAIDHKNRIWVGSVAGINIWDPAQKKVHIPQMDDASGFRMASNYISSIVPGYDNFFWIGTWGGGLFQAWFSEDEMEDISIRYVADLDGYIVGGGNYLYAWNGNSITAFNLNTEKVIHIDWPEQELGSMNFSSVCTSKEDVVWIGARNTLLRYSMPDEHLERIQLPIDEDFIISGIIEDQNGVLWGCNSHTIFSYDPVGKEFSFFPLPESLPMKKFIPFPFRKTKEGDILVCGYNGFITFNPEKSILPQVENQVLVTALKINNESLFPGSYLSDGETLSEVIHNCKDLTLAFEDRSFELEFSSFPYNRIEQERYAFMLSGYDKTWRLTEAQSNKVAYKLLPPGNYEFLVKSASGKMPSQTTSLRIKVKPPFWTSSLMLIIYVGLFLAIIAIFIFLFSSSKKDKLQMEKIRSEKDKNELINTSKTRFFVNVSHELLNSIGLITYPLKKLLSNSDIDDKTRDSLLHIDRNAYFLKAYIDQLLNFRTLELGNKVRRVDGRVELISFVKQVVKLFKNKALSKGIVLKFRTEIRELNIDTDEEKLHSILQNLLNNAITFTPEGGQVVLSLKHVSNKEVLIEVKDNGIGIPEEEQEKIFERFYQLPHEEIANRGMGIGLTIVKDFVEMLSGHIEVKSRKGKGTSMRVFLPSHFEDIQKLEEGALTREYVNWESIEKSRQSFAYALNGANGLPALLVVDENIEFFDQIQSSCPDKFTTYWAPSAEEAMDLMKENIPAVILSEIQLPGMDGISFCQWVKGKPKTSRIPFIFLTTVADVEIQLSAVHAGADVFLTKPCDLAILEAHFTNLIRRVEKTKEFISRRIILNAPMKDLGSKDDKLLKEMVDFIHKNITNSQLTADEISYALGISHSNLYRKTKQLTNLSLNEFVRQVRLQNAERLLSEGKLSVAEVMFEVGFSNHSYFSKCFKKLYNTTPKNYAIQAAKQKSSA